MRSIWCPGDLTVVPGSSARWDRADETLRSDVPMPPAGCKKSWKGVRCKYVTFRLSACSTLDRLTIFGLLFGIPLYKLTQGTSNQVIY